MGGARPKADPPMITRFEKRAHLFLIQAKTQFWTDAKPNAELSLLELGWGAKEEKLPKAD